MANAQPAPNLRPMRPIQRVPFVEENLPLVGPPLTDPNDKTFAATPAAAASASADPLVQTVASHDLNPPFGAMADRAAGIGQSHPAEEARIRGAVRDFAETAAEKAAAARLAVIPALKSLGAAASELAGLPALGAGAAKALGNGLAGVVIPSTPLNKGEDELVRQMHERDPAWQEMLRRQKEDPTYSPLHDDP